MEEKEIWKDVKGFEGQYQVSNLGRVKSLPRLVRSGNRNGMSMLREKILKHKIQKNGYHKIGLSSDGEVKYFLVHRLVYASFMGDIPEGLVVNHKDECKDNNTLKNLNLLTPKENSNWGTVNYRISKKCKIKVIMDEDKIFYSVGEAANYLGCAHTTISACCRKHQHTVYGHKFRYK